MFKVLYIYNVYSYPILFEQRNSYLFALDFGILEASEYLTGLCPGDCGQRIVVTQVNAPDVAGVDVSIVSNEAHDVTS